MTDDAPSPEPTSSILPSIDARDVGYRVLARKYRPAGFDGLIGQETLVRTLSNAFQSGRIAQAYMLTGVRGVGKTTTARIIARALNCVGPDGMGGPTASPCGQCEPCRTIGEDRNVDVQEIDAASRSGVGEIRELIDGVRYRPTIVRFKIYIIDEVHMLSTAAFNALLKTLEEPPEHVRFVFATTEIRKVPVTVLSRCQRFDLRRIGQAELAAHYGQIAAAEGVTAEPEALQLIARAADGSVRDGLSLLDQAIARAEGEVTTLVVRDMLGLADRAAVFDLYRAVMQGETALALDSFSEQHAAGADPAVVLEDLLDLTHWLTRIKIVPKAAKDAAIPDAVRVEGQALAERLGMAELSRAWQILLKGLGETRSAPSPIRAAEMVLVRLAYAARLPSPADLIRVVNDRGEPSQPQPRSPGAGSSAGATSRRQDAQSVAIVTDPRGGDASGTMAMAMAGPALPARSDVDVAGHASEQPHPATFAELVERLPAWGANDLYGFLKSAAHLVRFEPGCLELRFEPHVPGDVPGRLAALLKERMGRTWPVVVTPSQAGAETLLAAEEAATTARLAAASDHPFVRSVLELFPGATVTAVRSVADRAAANPAGEEDEADMDDRGDGGHGTSEDEGAGR